MTATRWFVLGAFAIAVAVLIPAIAGGELSEAWWAVMAGFVLTGAALLVIGVVTVASGRPSDGRSAHPEA